MPNHQLKAAMLAAATLAPALAVAAPGLGVAPLGLAPPSLVQQAQFATEWTQIMNNAQLVQMGGEQIRQSAQFAQQITNQIQQIQNQLRMYQTMLQNTAALPQRIWDQAQSDIGRLAQLTQQGQGLAFSMGNIDGVFRQRFSSYDTFLGQNLTGGSFSQAYSSWSTTQRDTIASTLKTANLTGDQLTLDADLLKRLQGQSETADGQMRALQVGHSLASLQVDQMLKLRALIAQQTVMFGQVFGRRQAIEEQQQAADRRYFQSTAPVSIEGGKEY
ncbi:MAG: P-type conjugative transfer protein TrbJ [Methylobacterium sp.]|nr:P-type conjugative transfer protein TrbJ [Methylobacterium sp.]